MYPSMILLSTYPQNINHNLVFIIPVHIFIQLLHLCASIKYVIFLLVLKEDNINSVRCCMCVCMCIVATHFSSSTLC